MRLDTDSDNSLQVTGLQADLKRWKRISGVLAGTVCLCAMAVIVLLSLFAVQSAQQRAAVSAVQREAEEQREIAVQMWQASEAALQRARQKLAEQDAR